MKIEGLLPVGTVVMLKEGTHRVMIIGYCQRLVDEPEKLFDYVGCLFPEGYLSAEKNYLFNRDQIDQIHHVGCVSEGQMAFVEKMEAAIDQLR